jgi:hypothetical protein
MNYEQLCRALRRRIICIEPGAQLSLSFREKRQLWREAYELAREIQLRGLQGKLF